MNPIVISHSDDLDGIAAGAMVRMRYGVPLDRIFYTDYTKERRDDVARQIRKLDLKDADLFVLDLNPDPDGTFLGIIDAVKKNGGRVFWLDHHPWSKAAIRKIASRCDVAVVGENRKFCATEIAIRHFGLKGRFIRKLARTVHYSDFNITPRGKEYRKLVKAYALGISYYNMICSPETGTKKLRLLASQLAEGRLVSRELASAARKFEKVNSRRVGKMLADLHLVGETIAVGFSRGVQATMACGEIIRKSNRDIAFCISTEKGKASMRSVKSDITGLAVSFGGGGHPHAAGFEVDTKRYNLATKKGRRRLIRQIEENAGRLGLLGGAMGQAGRKQPKNS
jgi:oligoribonuclease NrnB/cAMP/cGMP phosphodiesterase (DHH superfamily)